MTTPDKAYEDTLIKISDSHFNYDCTHNDFIFFSNKHVKSEHLYQSDTHWKAHLSIAPEQIDTASAIILKKLAELQKEHPNLPLIFKFFNVHIGKKNIIKYENQINRIMQKAAPQEIIQQRANQLESEKRVTNGTQFTLYMVRGYELEYTQRQ